MRCHPESTRARPKLSKKDRQKIQLPLIRAIFDPDPTLWFTWYTRFVESAIRETAIFLNSRYAKTVPWIFLVPDSDSAILNQPDKDSLSLDPRIEAPFVP